jgi:hypothetical protein
MDHSPLTAFRDLFFDQEPFCLQSGLIARKPLRVNRGDVRAVDRCSRRHD